MVDYLKMVSTANSYYNIEIGSFLKNCYVILHRLRYIWPCVSLMAIKGMPYVTIQMRAIKKYDDNNVFYNDIQMSHYCRYVP